MFYRDPLEEIWTQTALRLGIRVVRSSEVYASWDGLGTLRVGTHATFDADDSVAQLVFHELCHALVEGPDAFAKPDWGLSNVDDRDLVREHAAHRLQAALADRHGLRQFLAVTTEWRDHYLDLPGDPLSGEDPSVDPARKAFARACAGPWSGPLEAALRATCSVIRATAPFAGPDSLFSHET